MSSAVAWLIPAFNKETVPPPETAGRPPKSQFRNLPPAICTRPTRDLLPSTRSLGRLISAGKKSRVPLGGSKLMAGPLAAACRGRSTTTPHVEVESCGIIYGCRPLSIKLTHQFRVGPSKSRFVVGQLIAKALCLTRLVLVPCLVWSSIFGVVHVASNYKRCNGSDRPFSTQNELPGLAWMPKDLRSIPDAVLSIKLMITEVQGVSVAHTARPKWQLGVLVCLSVHAAGPLEQQAVPCSIRWPRDHMNIRILQTMVPGIPNVLRLSTRMSVYVIFGALKYDSS